jgi:hypothetical protein
MGDGGASRIRYELVQDLIKQHGEGAYTYALEKMATHEGDKFIASMWRNILTDLDEHFKGEGQ